MDSRFSTSSYCSKPKTRRWTIAFFSYVMDTLRVNIQTLVTLNNGKNPRSVNSFEFGKRLAMGLINPFLQQRDISGLSHIILLKMYLLTRDNKYLSAVNSDSSSATSAEGKILPYQGQSSQQAKRCGSCMVELRDIASSDARKKAKNSLCKSSSICERCGIVKCNKKHLVKLCDSCFKSC